MPKSQSDTDQGPIPFKREAILFKNRRAEEEMTLPPSFGKEK